MTADRRELVAVFAGGALGTIARAELAELIVHDPGSWPWATFAVNIVAAALLGYFTTRMHERPPLSAYRRPLLGPGLCGGLSTFATMQSELLGMLDAGHVGLALAYASVSLAVGLLVVSLTTRLTRHSGVTA